LSLIRRAPDDQSSFPRRCSHSSREAYLQETRADKIERYRWKKERRVWSRKISYNCRKVVADSRERKNGRFVRKEHEASVSGKEKRVKDKEKEREGRCKEELLGIEAYCL